MENTPLPLGGCRSVRRICEARPAPVVHDSGFGIQGPGFRGHGSVVRVQGPGCISVTLHRVPHEMAEAGRLVIRTMSEPGRLRPTPRKALRTSIKSHFRRLSQPLAINAHKMASSTD